MKLKFIKVKLLVLFLVVFVAVTGCGFGGSSNQQKRVVINIWGTFETSSVMDQLLAKYNKLNSNIQVVYTEKNVDTYENDLINALASGTGPDIFIIHNDWLPKYEDKMVAAPNSVFDIKTYNDTFLDVVNNDFVDNGKIYAAPMSVDNLALYYNKDILGSAGIATPPKTWQELSSDVRKISRINSSGYFTRSGVAMGTTSNINRAVDILYLLMLQDGAVPYSQDHTVSTLDQSLVTSSGNNFFPASDALNFYASFADPVNANYTWNAKSDYSTDAFANGQLAFLYGYSFTRDQIMQKSPNLNFDVAPVPQPNLDQNLVNFANYWGYGVSKQSKYSTTAWKLLAYLTSKPVLQQYYKLHNLPTSRRDMISDQINDPDMGIFASANLTAKSFYKKDQASVDQIILNMIDDVTLRGKNINDALNVATQQINALARR